MQKEYSMNFSTGLHYIYTLVDYTVVNMHFALYAMNVQISGIGEFLLLNHTHALTFYATLKFLATVVLTAINAGMNWHLDCFIFGNRDKVFLYVGTALFIVGSVTFTFCKLQILSDKIIDR